jgi:inorganic pyrophosphatase
MAIPLDRLPTRDPHGHYLVVVEAAAGSRNKFKFEPSLGALVLHAMLPLGTSFPYAFGFIPSTLGEDGDPLDALLFVDEPVPPGVAVPCRLVGAIRANQTQDGQTVRNDRLLMVAAKSHVYRRVEDLRDLDRRALEEIEAFFVFYNAQKEKKFEPLSRAGRQQAEKLVVAGQKALARKQR